MVRLQSSFHLASLRTVFLVCVVCWGGGIHRSLSVAVVHGFVAVRSNLQLRQRNVQALSQKSADLDDQCPPNQSSTLEDRLDQFRIAKHSASLFSQQEVIDHLQRMRDANKNTFKTSTNGDLVFHVPLQKKHVIHELAKNLGVEFVTNKKVSCKYSPSTNAVHEKLFPNDEFNERQLLRPRINDKLAYLPVSLVDSLIEKLNELGEEVNEFGQTTYPQRAYKPLNQGTSLVFRATTTYQLSQSGKKYFAVYDPETMESRLFPIQDGDCFIGAETRSGKNGRRLQHFEIATDDFECFVFDTEYETSRSVSVHDGLDRMSALQESLSALTSGRLTSEELCSRMRQFGLSNSADHDDEMVQQYRKSMEKLDANSEIQKLVVFSKSGCLREAWLDIVSANYMDGTSLARKELWDSMLSELKAYKEKHGNCNVPRRYPENKALGTWAMTQRNAYRHKSLSHDRISKLNELGFVWRVSPTIKWETMFLELVVYKQKNGNCNVPRNYPENNALGNWVMTQRKQYRDKSLSHERISKLNELGFVWDVSQAKWGTMFDKLLMYHQKNGNCNVPQIYPEDKALGLWVARQRKKYSDKSLSHDRISKLNELGFAWRVSPTKWETMFSELVVYKQKNGNCNVPNRYPENNALGTWVMTQRKQYRDKSLSHDRISKLNELGFVWDMSQTGWETMFSELVVYHQKNRNCSVPRNHSKNSALGNWVMTQRKRYRKKSLSHDRISELNELGFVWDMSETKWERMFGNLLIYHQETGNCNVPQIYPENNALKCWVMTQRKQYRDKSLSHDRISKLNELGFVWDMSQAKWETMFSELVVYKQKNGNCNVPQIYPENKALGRWVNAQRNAYRKKSLSHDRISELNELGFLWDGLVARKQS